MIEKNIFPVYITEFCFYKKFLLRKYCLWLLKQKSSGI